MATWGDKKPILEFLWLTENWELNRIVEEMRTTHKFHRVARQYTAQFAKWGWSKNVRNKDMTKVLQLCAGRAAADRSSSIVVNKRRLDPKKIRRQANSEMQAISRSLALESFRSQVTTVDGRVLPFSNNFFLKWNLPYAAIRHAYVRPFDHSSPFDRPTPCSHIEVTTPSTAASPKDAPSPTTQVVKKLTMVERARMFAHGEHDKLLKNLSGEERRTLSDWLYQYWFFCFKTAKHWGKGPRSWTAELLGFEDLASAMRSSLSGTPQDLVSSTPHIDSGPMPSNLCRWYIHVRGEDYVPLEGDELWSLGEHDLEVNPNWTTWSQSEQQSSLHTHLRDALEHNDFSATPAADLPVAIPQIAKAALEERSNELLIESLGFSIMSRNVDQTAQILRRLREKEINPAQLYPFHLATSYLDGYKACCEVIATLAGSITGVRVRETYWNAHEHTVLDNLMIAIIKSHTTASPAVVDEAFGDVACFVGEDVDICGRWDADSPCLRQLHSNGSPSTPGSWKHKFCNTSAQTICHCISQMFNHMPNPLLLETPSGLYIRRCFKNCGTKMQLSPLHSLVVTAFHLASEGRDDEDLFGILACALCMIFYGFSPCTRAEVSVAALLSLETGTECDHEALTPAELAVRFSTLTMVRSWSTNLQTGWNVLAKVLQRCEVAHAEQNDLEDYRSRHDPHDGYDYDVRYMGSVEPDWVLLDQHPDNETHLPLSFIRCPDLGALWSSVLAELSSYRRLDEETSWTSSHFSMKDLEEQLEQGEDLMVGYVRDNLLKAHCACHSYGRYPVVVLSEIMDPGLANLDIWGRATYGVLAN